MRCVRRVRVCGDGLCGCDAAMNPIVELTETLLLHAPAGGAELAAVCRRVSTGLYISTAIALFGSG